MERLLERERRRLLREPTHEKGTWFVFLGGGLLLLMALLLSDRAGSIALLSAAFSMFATGVAEYLPIRWRAGAVMLRVAALMLLVVGAFAFFLWLIY